MGVDLLQTLIEANVCQVFCLLAKKNYSQDRFSAITMEKIYIYRSVHMEYIGKIAASNKSR